MTGVSQQVLKCGWTLCLGDPQGSALTGNDLKKKGINGGNTAII